MTPTTYGRDFAYCLKSPGGVRGFNASLWRFLLRWTLFCHSVATFLTSVSSYEGGCGFEGILKRDADIMFFNGYRTSMEQMSEPNPKPLYKGMSAEGKSFMKSWEQLVKFGGICR